MPTVEIGATFERWTVVGIDVRSSRRVLLCRCRCGNTGHVSATDLKRGRSRSCGCLLVEVALTLHRTHGGSSGGRLTPEYAAWASMKKRCYIPSATGFENYGGRGIRVCDAWRESFPAFLGDVGPRPTAAHTLERIDNAADYAPGNVRWATRSEQNVNKRSNRVLTYEGQARPLTAWAKLHRIHPTTLASRLKAGVPLHDALHRAVSQRRCHETSTRSNPNRA